MAVLGDTPFYLWIKVKEERGKRGIQRGTGGGEERKETTTTTMNNNGYTSVGNC